MFVLVFFLSSVFSLFLLFPLFFFSLFFSRSFQISVVVPYSLSFFFQFFLLIVSFFSPRVLTAFFLLPFSCSSFISSFLFPSIHFANPVCQLTVFFLLPFLLSFLPFAKRPVQRSPFLSPFFFPFFPSFLSLLASSNSPCLLTVYLRVWTVAEVRQSSPTLTRFQWQLPKSNLVHCHILCHSPEDQSRSHYHPVH